MARPPYAALPGAVRAWVDAALGSPVQEATNEGGGFSPGVAARVACTDGTRAFVKAVSADVNPVSCQLHRAEAAVTAALPADLGSPRLLDVYDDGTWVGLVLEQIDGRPPTVPWNPAELEAAVRALDRLAAVPGWPELPAAEVALAEDFTGWRTLAAEPPADLAPWQRRHLDELVALENAWPAAAAGDCLLHLDLRGDNMLVRADGEVVLVDWPWAARGSPLLDVVGFLPNAMMCGVSDADAVLGSTTAGRAAPPEHVTSLIAAFTGLMEHACRQPPPPGISTVRAFQRAQARTGGRWLRLRTGW